MTVRNTIAAAAGFASSAASADDPYFKNVSLLLKDAGTNGAQNNTFLDSSTNNFTITRNGTPTQGSVTPYWPDGQWSNYFDTANTIVTVNGTTSSGNIPDGTDFTIEFWMMSKLVNSGGGVAIGKTAFQSNTGDSWFMETNKGTGSNKLTFTLHNGSSIVTPVTSTTAVLDCRWHHCAVTRQGTTYRIFIDGALEQTTVNATTMNQGTRNVTVGGITFNTSNFASQGYLSNVRIVKGTALYTATFTPSTTPLTAVTNTLLLTCQSNRFKDNSSNNFAITVTGTPTVQAFEPFEPASSYATSVGGSGYFSGGTSGLSIPSNSAFTLGTTDFTIEAWIYATVAPSGTAYTIMRQRVNGSLAWNLQIQSGTMYFCYGGGYTGFSEPVKVGVWEHYAVVKLSGSMYLYKNGVLSTTIANNFNFSATDGVLIGIGGDSSDTAYPFTGYIANARVVKGTAVYTSAFSPPSTPVTAMPNTSLLLNFTNAGIYDSTTLNNLVTVGNAQVSTVQSKFGSSMAFDGTGDYLTYPAGQNTVFGTGDFTVEFWTYFNNSASTPFYFIDTRNSGQTANWCLYRASANTLNWFTGGTEFFGPSLSTINTWTHIAVTRSGTSLRLFINGILLNTFTDSTNYSTAPTIAYIGCRFSISEFLSGHTEDFRITKGYARYTANFTPPTTALPKR